MKKTAYNIEIKPSTLQKQKIHQNIGNCRFVYNLYVRHLRDEHEKWQDDDSYKPRYMNGFAFSKCRGTGPRYRC